jgi:hypothetical protein
MTSNEKEVCGHATNEKTQYVIRRAQFYLLKGMKVGFENL